ncbi:MAG: D-2-hydroxyacid dehydrogenase [Bacillota bacterium]|jgi:phosphoglycerate dehydrogenase-like enzyme|nr:D-2-hydroxyacid dehydrogenase [Candidatus Fermentithermobacillaceae bacterium]
MSANHAKAGLRLLKTTEWHEWQKDAIREVVEDPVFLEPDTSDKLEDLILEADILFGSPAFSPAILAKSKTLKLVHVGSTGVDGYMIPEFQQSDIILVNSRGVHGTTVADHAVAMLLALSRGFHDAWKDRRHKKWDPQGQSIVNLPGKTAGLLGLGAIGMEVAARCKAFGMRVIGIRRNPQQSEAVDLVLPPSGLDQLLSESDFVVCSLPLTKETRHLLTIREFSLMKPSAFFINVGRGAVVKEEDLISALSQGLIKGAGLDVFEEEPLAAESPLWDMPNVIMTPHSAGFDEEHAKNTFDIFLKNLVRFQQGLPLINQVDKELGY